MPPGRKLRTEVGGVYRLNGDYQICLAKFSNKIGSRLTPGYLSALDHYVPELPTFSSFSILIKVSVVIKTILYLVFCLFPLMTKANNTLTFQSGGQQTTLIELYSSEGCSSCPPADKWLSKLKNDPTLWQDFVPIAFHVDYWDYIGWKDPLVLPGNTQRQGQYQAENNIGFVYTPAFVINGQEWQGWFDSRSLPEQKRPLVGILKAEIKGDTVNIHFLGAINRLEYHVAVLGFDIQSHVKTGENEGRTLNHDFVALSHDTVSATTNQVSMKLAESGRFNSNRRAIAIWISSPDSQTPIQSLGGWLP
jgi:hypothetical protein